MINFTCLKGCPSSPFWGTKDFLMDICPSTSGKGFTEMSRDATYDITENISKINLFV